MLKNLRQEIDEIDEKLLCLLAKRMQISKAIGEYKKEQGLPALDGKRWQKVLSSRIKIGKKHDLTEETIKRIWESIHLSSLEVQQ